MTVEKLKVSKEVAEALNELQSNFLWDNEDILTTHIKNGGEWSNKERQCLKELSIGELATALFIGYEVEEKVILPEKVSEGELAYLVAVFKGAENAPMFSYKDGIKDGIIRVLTHLDIKVKGINM